MSEKLLEAGLRRKVVALGGMCDKWTGTPGAPDRIVMLPGGRVIFVEMKAPGGRLAKIQEKKHRDLRALGMDVRVLASKEAVDAFIEEVMPK